MLKIVSIWLAWSAVGGAVEISEIPHPRLWFPKNAEASVQSLLKADPLAAKLETSIVSEAEKILKARTCRYEIPDGKRLLAESRLAVHNVFCSAWAWRMSGEEKFRTRTIAELEAACAMKDWNTSHFLDTGEMATAVATGYDWLFTTLTPEQRAMCEQSLIEKALKPAKKIYDKNEWWSKPHNNWSQVCGAGITLAAIALAEKEPILTKQLIDSGITLISQCGKFYQPDGMYPEGPGYWQYGTTYHVLLLAACEAMDMPMEDDPMMSKAGDSIMHLASPSGMTYNFADGRVQKTTPSFAQCWLATHFKHPAQSRYVRDALSAALASKKVKFSGDCYFPLAMLWLPKAAAVETPVPTAAVFHGEQAMAIFRTGWKKDSAWLAIKGGTAAASHGHMDVGSFAYDAHGLRWFHDLGKENYNLPGYSGGKRWSYFRLQNRSHNTLEIDGQLQNAKSKPCPITASSLTGNPYSATFDISDAYAGAAVKIIRSASFDHVTGKVLLEDQITQPTGEVCWRAFTDAEAEVNENQVILRKNGKQIHVRNLSKTGTWTITDAKPPSAEEFPNKEFRALVLTFPKTDPLTITVEIQP